MSGRITSCLMVGVLMAAGTASGETVTETALFQMNLSKQAVPEFTVLQAGDHDIYTGFVSPELKQFDDQGGTLTLQQVDLTLNMTIAGTIHVYYGNNDDPAAAAFQIFNYQPDGVNITLSGNAATATTPALSADAGFNSPFAATPTNDIIQLNEIGTPGTDSINANLTNYIGQSNIDILISAMVDVVYEIGDVGAAEGLFASGDVSLTYTYTTTTPGVLIPTPAAAGMGLALLAGTLVRRRRRGV